MEDALKEQRKEYLHKLIELQICINNRLNNLSTSNKIFPDFSKLITACKKYCKNNKQKWAKLYTTLNQLEKIKNIRDMLSHPSMQQTIIKYDVENFMNKTFKKYNII